MCSYEGLVSELYLMYLFIAQVRAFFTKCEVRGGVQKGSAMAERNRDVLPKGYTHQIQNTNFNFDLKNTICIVPL